MRLAWVWVALVAAGCTFDPHVSGDGPGAPVDAAHADAAHADAVQLVDAMHLDAGQLVDAMHVDATADAVPPDAVPPDAVPPDAAPVLPLLWTDGGDLGLVEVSFAGTGFVRFDNNSGADVVLDNTYVTGTDYTVLGSTCTGTIPDQGWCRVDVQIIPTALGPRPGQVVVAGPAGAAHADLTAEGGGRIYIVFAGAGSGGVGGPGFMCTGSCAAVMSSAGPLYAGAMSMSTFVGWSDPGCGSSPTCYVTPTIAPQTITATFAIDPNARKLTVTRTGAGKGAVTVEIHGDVREPCTSSSCQYLFMPGDSIHLQAFAASVFDGWSGPCTGSDFTCSLTGMVNTTATAAFGTDPHEQVTFLEPTISPSTPAQEVGADGTTYVTDGYWLTAYDPGGAELWSIPVTSAAIEIHGLCLGTFPDGAGGSWELTLGPSGEAVQASHYDADGNLLGFFGNVSSYDTMCLQEPSTGIPLIASTGHSRWRIIRPGTTFLDEDIGDFASDIAHAIFLDSTGAIIAARPRFDSQAGGIARVRYSSAGTLLEDVRHSPISEAYGLRPQGISAGPDGIVVYSGELSIGPTDWPATHYRWIQVLDYVP